MNALLIQLKISIFLQYRFKKYTLGFTKMPMTAAFFLYMGPDSSLKGSQYLIRPIPA